MLKKSFKGYRFSFDTFIKTHFERILYICTLVFLTIIMTSHNQK